MKRLLLLGLLVSCAYGKTFQEPTTQALQHIDKDLSAITGYVTHVDMSEWVPMMLKKLPLQTAQEKLTAQTQQLSELSRSVQLLEEELQHGQVHQVSCEQVRSIEQRLARLQVQAGFNLSSGQGVIKIEHGQASWSERAAQVLRGNLPRQMSDLLQNYVTTLTNVSIAVKRIMHILVCE